MRRLVRGLAIVLLLAAAGKVTAQDAPPAWPSPLPALAVQAPPPPPDVVALPPAGELDGRLGTLRGDPAADNGQQHWVALNLALGQPSVARVQVKVLPRENNSVWVEAYAGSVLLDGMYGFGARVQHTAWASPRGSRLMVAPGLGVHILPPVRSDGWWFDSGSHGTMTFLAADVDVSWLYDFAPRCGFELGVKAGVGVRMSGHYEDCYPRNLMWGSNAYPILAVYSGLRF